MFLALATVAFGVRHFPPSESLALTNVQPAAGAGYAAKVVLAERALFELSADSEADPRRSTLQMFEDGRRLGPGHSVHDDIFALGQGRYSHWLDSVVFSASDNTDPRTNNRQYTALAVYRPAPLWTWAGLGFLTLALFALRPERWVLGGFAWAWPRARATPAFLAGIVRGFWRTPSALGGSAVAIVLALLALVAAAPIVSKPLSPEMISAVGGHGYVADAPTLVHALYKIDSDSAAAPRRSTLFLTEDGRPIGEPHTGHASIAEDGRGRFSHWQGAVLFSTPDNSDPRTNGRRYAAGAKASVKPIVLWPALALVVLALARGLAVAPAWRASLARVGAFASRHVGLAAVAIVSLAIALAGEALWRASAFHPILYTDSPSYLNAPWMRGYFYYGLLNAGAGLGLTAPFLVVMHFAAFSLGVSAIGWAVARASGSRLVGALCATALITNVQILGFMPGLLSEPLFTAFVLVHLAFGIEALRSGRPRDLAIAAAAAGLAILVRPAGIGLLVGVVALVLVIRPWSTRRALAALTGAAAAMAIGVLPNLVMHGKAATHAVGGIAVVGHVLHFADADAPYADPELAHAIIERVDAISKAEDAAFPDAYWQATTNEYNALLWGAAVRVADQELRQRMAADGVKPNKRKVELAAEDALRSMAVTIILDNPIAYARLVLAHVYGMWEGSFERPASLGQTVHDGLDDTQRIARDYPVVQVVTGAAAYPPAPVAAQWRQAANLELPVAVVSEFVRAPLRETRWLIAAATLATLLVMVVTVARNQAAPVWLVAAAFCALQLWTYIGLVAAAQPAIARYTGINALMIMPFLALSGIGLAGAAARRCRSWLARRAVEAGRSVGEAPPAASLTQEGRA
jgi:hypothetical protein